MLLQLPTVTIATASDYYTLHIFLYFLLKNFLQYTSLNQHYRRYPAWSSFSDNGRTAMLSASNCICRCQYNVTGHCSIIIHHTFSLNCCFSTQKYRSIIVTVAHKTTVNHDDSRYWSIDAVRPNQVPHCSANTCSCSLSRFLCRQVTLCTPFTLMHLVSTGARCNNSWHFFALWTSSKSSVCSWDDTVSPNERYIKLF